MSAENRQGWRFSLKSKLLAVLIPVMAISVLVAMLGLCKFLHEFFKHSAESETALHGQVLQSALRQSMLQKTELNVSETLADVAKTPSVQRVLVTDKNGRVVYAADRAEVGRVFDRKHDAICKICHVEKITPEMSTLFTQNEAGTPIIRHIRPFANEKACWGCHDAKNRVNGILLIEESTQTYQDALWTVERRVSATGGVILAVLATTTLLVTTMLVERPVRRLIRGVRQLGTGDLSARVSARSSDELAELAGSFNGMAENLGHSIEEVHNKNTELSVVYTMVERLIKTINLSELKEIILQTLMDVLRTDRVLLVNDEIAQTYREVLMRKRGVNRIYRFGYSTENDGQVPEDFPSAIVDDWGNGELNGPLLSADRKSAAIPIHIDGRRLGLLVVQRERSFEQPEGNPRLLGTLADHIGIALENARLYTLAMTDELTQLFTVRHFRDRIEKAIVQCEREEQQLGLLLLDLDHFKAINDQWGHLAGDEVLRRVAQLLLSTIRLGDSAYRYGGEEFVILLSETNLATVKEVAERIRQTIQLLEIPMGGKNIGVTVSIGVAIYPGHGKSRQELVAVADTALYEAKRTGRNRVSEAPTRLGSALV